MSSTIITAKISRWIEKQLAAHALNQTGNIVQVQVQPWGIVLRIPTNKGDLYFKAAGGSVREETAVTATLARLQPHHLPHLYAANTTQSWLLMADGGQRLREAFQEGLPMTSWHNALADYAQFQLTIAPHANTLLRQGTRDRRLENFPKLYEWLLADVDWLLIGEEGGLTAAEYEQAKAAVPMVAALCERLAAFKVPASIHHNDLHDGNIFVRNGRYRFFDWGDSSISHPFFSLRTAFVSIESRFNLDERDPIFDTFAASYLKPWETYESKENLWQAYRLARPLWSISSAIKYKTILAPYPAARADYAIAVPSLLQEFLAELALTGDMSLNNLSE
ncbi:MAG: phosphotransferase [Chloroflexota bacterium]